MYVDIMPSSQEAHPTSPRRGIVHTPRNALPNVCTCGRDLTHAPREALPTAFTFGMVHVPREPPPTVATSSILHTSRAPLAQATLPPPPPAEVAEKPQPQMYHLSRAERTAKEQAHYAVVLEAAQMVTEILNRYGFPCAVFGSLAAKLYGSARFPKDVDMLVSQEPTLHSRSLTAEELKDLIMHSEPHHFYLKHPRDPAAEYRILWYRQRNGLPGCKVDILVPGTMYLPRLPRHRVVFLSPHTEGVEGWNANNVRIPVFPFALLLAFKLQGWADHYMAKEAYQSNKQHQDAEDVQRLLGLRKEMRILEEARLAGRDVWSDRELFEENYQPLIQLRVAIYSHFFPDYVDEWWKIGFDVDFTLRSLLAM